jgi:hypothetical protein
MTFSRADRKQASAASPSQEPQKLAGLWFALLTLPLRARYRTARR